MIGIFGGTFNPIHNGHCRMAVELIDHLGLEKLHVVPCGLPPHREIPEVGAEQRLAMVQAAFLDDPKVVVDDCEIRRQGPSYSLDTVKLLRDQYADQPIVLIVGDDSFRSFDSWHGWRSILDVVHVVVLRRPQLPNKTDASITVELKDFIDGHVVSDVELLSRSLAGCIYYQDVTQIDISSTRIREDVVAGKSVDSLVPASVGKMISDESLYR